MRLLLALSTAMLLAIGISATSFAADSSLTGNLVEVLHQKGVIDDASYDDLKKTEGGEQAVNKKLIEVLHAKGVLDDAAYQKLSAQAEAEVKTPAEAAPETPKATAAGPKPSEPTVREAVKPLDKALCTVEDGVARLGGDTVKMKISYFFQGGFLNDDAGFSVQAPPTTNRSTTSGNQFFVRRARLYFDGTILEKVGFKLSTEMSDANGKILRDAYVYADYIPYARITVGQMKVPFGVEGVESLSSNPTINRSFATNFMHAITNSLTTLRDQGATLSGKYQTKIAGLPFGIGYAGGAFNGTGQNATDDNDAKDVAGRVWINPLVEGLTVGGSGYDGKSHFGSLPNDYNRNRYKWAADIDYNPPFVKGLKIRGEAMWEKRFFDTYQSKNLTTTPGDAVNRFDRALGMYALAAYKVDGLQGMWQYLNGFEPVFRYDTLDEDLSTPATSRDRWTLGLNYYLAKDTRLMVNYEIIHADGSLRKKSFETIDTESHHLVTTVFQLKF